MHLNVRSLEIIYALIKLCMFFSKIKKIAQFNAILHMRFFYYDTFSILRSSTKSYFKVAIFHSGIVIDRYGHHIVSMWGNHQLVISCSCKNRAGHKNNVTGEIDFVHSPYQLYMFLNNISDDFLCRRGSVFPIRVFQTFHNRENSNLL